MKIKKTKKVTIEVLTRGNRTMDGLRDRLFSELDELIDGRSNYKRAEAVIGISEMIIKSVSKELEYSRFVKECGEDDVSVSLPKFELVQNNE